MSGRDWFIAWLDTETDAFDPVAHMRRDVPVASVSFQEEEQTDAVTVTVTRDGISSSVYAGKAWAMLSYQTPDGVLHPVCRMKLKPRHLGQRDSIGTVTFEALPTNWLNIRTAGVQPYKILPAFDPLFVDPSRYDDPMEVFDGHQRVGRFDRVTQAYDAPSTTGVGLPKRTFGMKDIVGWADGGGITCEQTETPLAGVLIILTAEWLQRLFGSFDVSSVVKALFPSGFIETLDGDTLESSWFKPGAALGGATGYTVARSVLTEVSAPFGANPRRGPFNGSKQRYNYVVDPNLNNPQPMTLAVKFYDVSLSLDYKVNQKRVEVIQILVRNNDPLSVNGELKVLKLRTSDVTADTTTPAFQPGILVTAGTVIRSGEQNYTCLLQHVTAATFGGDQATIQNGQIVPLWAPNANDASAIGGQDRATYFQTDRGIQTVHCAILKAARLIEESMRCVEVSFVVPFEDVVDMHTGYLAHVDADDTLIPGGSAEGKVTRFQVSDPDLSSVPLATITFRAIPGTGAAANVGAGGGIGYTDQPWDMISLDEVSGAGAQPFPAVGCQKAVVINGADGQATYIAANDYQRGVAGRSDKTANDPKSLVKQVKTTVGMYLTDVSGKKDMTSLININTGGYNGPRQIVLPGQS